MRALRHRFPACIKERQRACSRCKLQETHTHTSPSACTVEGTDTHPHPSASRAFFELLTLFAPRNDTWRSVRGSNRICSSSPCVMPLFWSLVAHGQQTRDRHCVIAVRCGRWARAPVFVFGLSRAFDRMDSYIAVFFRPGEAHPAVRAWKVS